MQHSCLVFIQFLLRKIAVFFQSQKNSDYSWDIWITWRSISVAPTNPAQFQPLSPGNGSSSHSSAAFSGEKQLCPSPQQCREYFSATRHHFNREFLQNIQILNPASGTNAAARFPPTAMTSVLCYSWRCWEVSNSSAQMQNETPKKSTFWYFELLKSVEVSQF